MPAENVMRKYYEKEAIVFSQIPGMRDLLRADAADAEKISMEYPDASFALQIANSLFQHDRELSEIHQSAYFSILNGEAIANVRHKYDKDISRYVSKHNWDD